MKLYHATYQANLESIFEYGLGAIQNKNWDISIDGVVCFSDDMDMAISFCETAENVNDDVYDSGIVCLEVDSDKLNDSLLSLDPNLLCDDNDTHCYLYRGVIEGSQCTICFDENKKDIFLEENFMKDIIKSEKSLAARLNDFYKDFDFYDYMDSVQVGEHDIIDELVAQLSEPVAVAGMLENLREIKENGELDEEQTRVLDKLIEEVKEVQSSMSKSINTVITEATERSEQCNMSNNIKVDILQLKEESKNRYIRFLSTSKLKNGADSVEYQNYDNVYNYSCDNNISLLNDDEIIPFLEEVYMKFNLNHPYDFKGHSLSVSDVVVVSSGNNVKAFYCNSIGFEKLPEKFVEEFKKDLHNTKINDAPDIER